MRCDSTDAERKLWWILRSRKLDGFKFRRQHPVAGYIVDFICIKHQLVIEPDGGQHDEPAARAYDEKRTKRLEEVGLRVIRFWDPDVLKHPHEVAESIYEALTFDSVTARGQTESLARQQGTSTITRPCQNPLNPSSFCM
jgi:very-short-patch-repair endonuclease